MNNFWEENVYSRGHQVNRWPFDEVISAVKRERFQLTERKIRVLELGCGTGNNLWFLSSEGFETYGLDISPSAVTIATEFLAEKECVASVGISDLMTLPFESGHFDLTLDRGCFTQILWSKLPKVVSEVHRVLAPSGVHLSFTLFGDRHPDRRFGYEVEPGTFDRFSEGQFSVVGPTSFFGAESLSALFNEFGEVELRQNCSYVGGKIRYEDYQVRARKRR